MYRNALILLFLFVVIKSMCQPAGITDTDKGKDLQLKYGILSDRNYSIEKIAADTALQFAAMPDSILTGRIYWLKITAHNPNPSHRDYVLNISPHLNNTLYFFDPDRKQWRASRSDALNNSGSRLLGHHRVSFAGQRSTSVFVQVDLTGVQHKNLKVKLAVSFQPKALADRNEQSIRVAWVCCMVVLLVFMLNNLYVYYSFRDKAVLYYLIAQLGGMIYITGYRWFFYELLPARVFNVDVHDKITYYDVNRIMVHLAIAITFYGLIAFTRSFLNTKIQLPQIDRFLRHGIRIYAVLTVLTMAVNLSGFDLEYYTLPYDNIFCLLLVFIVIAAGIAAYRRKLPFAAAFLLANVLPLIFMLGIPLVHLIVPLQNEEDHWIPELVVMTQALAFSIALVARTKAIQKELLVSEINNRQLEFDLKEAGFRVQLNQLEIAKMNSDIDSGRTKNNLLQERLETNQRELASSTLYMVQKNELLNHLKSQIQLLSRPNPSTSQGMRAMTSLIETSTQLDADWKKFKMHFEQVHPLFFEELKTRHPQLTMKETRLYAYFHMKLSHKEIAALLDIDPASVRRAKTRLFKKMAIPDTE